MDRKRKREMSEKVLDCVRLRIIIVGRTREGAVTVVEAQVERGNATEPCHTLRVSNSSPLYIDDEL